MRSAHSRHRVPPISSLCACPPVLWPEMRDPHRHTAAPMALWGCAASPAGGMRGFVRVGVLRPCPPRLLEVSRTSPGSKSLAGDMQQALSKRKPRIHAFRIQHLFLQKNQNKTKQIHCSNAQTHGSGGRTTQGISCYTWYVAVGLGFHHPPGQPCLVGARLGWKFWHL